MSAGVITDPLRLAAVARVLPVGEANQEAFDRLAELAAIVMDTPVGMVNLVGAHVQHLVGLAGLGEPLATSRRLPIDVGCCPVTLSVGRSLFIDNAEDDPDLDHLGLTELGVAAYAGVQLRDDGQVIGTLCVTDRVAHRWRPSDRRAIEALAEAVVSEIALHRDVDRRQRLLDAFDAAPAAIALTRGRDHVVEYRNAAYRAIFGDLPIGLPASTSVPSVPERFLPLMNRVLASGQTFRATDASVDMVWPGESEPRERFFDLSYSTIQRDPRPRPGPAADPRGLLVVAVEVTDRVWARRDLEHHARRQQALVRAGEALNSKLDPAVALQELARVVVPDLADFASVHVLSRPAAPGAMPPLPVITDRVAVAAIPELGDLPALSSGLRWVGDGDPITETVKAGKLLRQPFVTPAPPPWSTATGSAATIRAGLRKIVLAPVIVDGLVIAVVSFGMCDERPAWGDEDLAALEEVARYAGIALGHGLSYQRTRESALVLQHSLLSDPPAVVGLELFARYRPAGRDEVGGDWYDVFTVGPGRRVAVVVGDVAGHDIAAAAAMGQLRASLRALALDHPAGPADVVDRLARINTELAITRFATLVYAQLTPCEHGPWTMRWAIAGHLPPLLIAAEASVLLTQATGAALIPLPSEPRTEAEVILPVGSTLLLYTDGLVERRDNDLSEALAALADRASRSVGLPVDQLCDEILGSAPIDDDIALLALRVCLVREGKKPSHPVLPECDGWTGEVGQLPAPGSTGELSSMGS